MIRIRNGECGMQHMKNIIAAPHLVVFFSFHSELRTPNSAFDRGES
jgi:hypothetical protein